MVFQNKLILLLKNIKLNLMNDIYVHANCPWAVAYNALFCVVHEPKYALPLQGGGSVLYVTQGDGATRLCPGLLCYAPSGRLNACLPARFIYLLRLCPGLLCYGLSARLNARLRRASYLFQTVKMYKLQGA